MRSSVKYEKSTKNQQKSKIIKITEKGKGSKETVGFLIYIISII